MKIDLEYGRRGLTCERPDDRVAAVLQLNSVPPAADQQGAVRAAVRDPFSARPLRELAVGRRDACIVICDVTRPVPNQTILPVLLDELAAGGIPRERVTILIATGNHRPNEGAELVEMIGQEIADTVRVVNHHSEVDAEQAYLGDSAQGVPILVDRTYAEADLKILTGLVEPHFMAGYSGGRKIVCPGLVSLKTVHYFHSPELLESPRATNGVLQGNPLHEFALEVCQRVGVDFTVNVVIDAERRICGVFAGELLAAHAAGVAFCDRGCRVEFATPADIVVTSSAGYPLDTTFYQVVKGMVGALPALRPGGTIIIAAEMAEGLGSPEFAEMLFAASDHASFMAQILAPEWTFTKDQWEVEMLCRVLRQGRVVVVSQGVDAATLERCLVSAAPTVEAAVAAALAEYGPAARIIAIPSGPYCIPTPRQAVRA
ncbi:MAG: nickel-dependent lactate racemase [Fimbriimonadaceae bacterium]|nr:nickel-dependent lactate racemase [Fimbriimonadaceae bacterium]